MKDKLYHATPRENVESIQRNGLIPKDAFVSLSEQKDSWIKDGYALFEVDVKGLNLSMYTYLPELDEITVWGKIEPSRLRLIYESHYEEAAKDAEIARLKNELAAKKKRIAGLVKDVDHKNGHIIDKQYETLRLERRIALLEAALKPVMECALENKMCRAITVKSDDDEMDARLKVSVWIDMSNAVSAIREAQRIMKEGV